jgi:hypothetical protein
MHVDCLSHFIVINTSHQYKTKLFQYNTLLMLVKISHMNYVDFILLFEM